MGGCCQRGSGKKLDRKLESDGYGHRSMEENWWIGQNSQTVAAPGEEEYQFGGQKLSNSIKRWQLGW